MSDNDVFTRLKLGRTHAFKVSLTALYVWDEEAQTKLAPLLGDGDGWLSALKYRNGGQECSLTETVVRPTEPDPQTDQEVVIVHIDYDRPSGLPVGPVPKEFRNDRVLLGLLKGLTQIPHIRCDLQFKNDTFAGEGNARQMWFPLPTPISTSRNDDPPVDAITGIRGVKRKSERGGEVVDYSFTIERADEDPAFFSVTFYLDEELRSETPVRALRRATDFGRSLGVL